MTSKSQSNHGIVQYANAQETGPMVGAKLDPAGVDAINSFAEGVSDKLGQFNSYLGARIFGASPHVADLISKGGQTLPSTVSLQSRFRNPPKVTGSAGSPVQWVSHPTSGEILPIWHPRVTDDPKVSAALSGTNNKNPNVPNFPPTIGASSGGPNVGVNTPSGSAAASTTPSKATNITSWLSDENLATKYPQYDPHIRPAIDYIVNHWGLIDGTHSSDLPSPENDWSDFFKDPMGFVQKLGVEKKDQEGRALYSVGASGSKLGERDYAFGFNAQNQINYILLSRITPNLAFHLEVNGQDPLFKNIPTPVQIDTENTVPFSQVNADRSMLNLPKPFVSMLGSRLSYLLQPQDILDVLPRELPLSQPQSEDLRNKLKTYKSQGAFSGPGPGTFMNPYFGYVKLTKKMPRTSTLPETSSLVYQTIANNKLSGFKMSFPTQYHLEITAPQIYPELGIENSNSYFTLEFPLGGQEAKISSRLVIDPSKNH